MSTDLIAELRAALDADGATARAAADGDSGEWFVGDKWNVYRTEGAAPHDDAEENRLVVYGNVQPQSAHIARHDPAFVLADIAAKRKLLDELLAEGHAAVAPGGSTEVYCDAGYGQGGTCTCGRDERTERYVRLLAEAYGIPERCNAAGDSPNSLGTERCDLPAGHDGRHYEGNTTWPNRSTPRA